MRSETLVIVFWSAWAYRMCHDVYRSSLCIFVWCYWKTTKSVNS